MPISPTPPSGTKTSSSRRRSMLMRRGCCSGREEHVAGGDPVGRAPSVAREHQTARRIDALEPPVQRARRRSTATGSPRPAARREPRRADRGEACAARPTRSSRRPWRAASAANSVLGVTGDAAGGEIGRRIGGIVGMVRQLTPKPMTTASGRRPRFALDQDAGELGAAEQDVVRPFEREASAPRRRTAGDRVDAARAPATKRELRRERRRRRVDQQQRSVEVARAARPRPGRAGRARRSARRRRSRAARARRRARSANASALVEPTRVERRRRRKLRGSAGPAIASRALQKKDLAAAPAAATERRRRLKTKSRTNSAADAERARSSPASARSCRAGSSKYMILTMRR